MSRLIYFIKKKILKYLDLFLLHPPYDYVQSITEHSIHRYLNLDRKDIKKWVIVGGHLGYEVPTILKNYPNCEVVIFECSLRYIKKLKARFSKNSRVTIIDKTISDKKETVNFYETNIEGSGSMLKVSDSSKKYNLEQAENYKVNTTTLDAIFPKSNIDVLQIDVQGAELKVLLGARKILKEGRVKSVFTEVSITADLYKNSVAIKDLHNQLRESGFFLSLLGLDINLQGNALYLHNFFMDIFNVNKNKIKNS